MFKYKAGGKILNMKLQQRILLLALLLLIYSNAFSQNNPTYTSSSFKDSSIALQKNNYKNDVRTALYFTRLTIAYDRFLSKKFSIGAEGQAHWGLFPGFQTSILGRYYLKSLKKSGFFLEEKLTYGFYQPIVYDSIYIPSYGADDSQTYGEHNGHLSYWASTSCVGYRAYSSETFFIEFLVGVRKGILIDKSNGVMYTDGNDLPISTLAYSTIFNGGNISYPSNVFNTVGPGSPFCFNIRLGVRF
jgi:hypothetical protein